MKKIVEGFVAELKKSLVKRKLVFGSERCLKLLRDKKLKKVYFSSNCSPAVKEDFVYYCGLFDVPFEDLPKDSEEIGVICRKPFSISVVGVL